MTRWLVILLLLVGTGLYGSLHPPANLAAGRGVLRRVPELLGDWNGTELSFEDAVVDELHPDDLLVRRYTRGTDLVWLCIVYHQNRRYGAHDPHVCYESQGYHIEDEHDAAIEDGTPGGIPARWFVARRAKGARLVAYWWNTSGLRTTDPVEFRRRMALRGALDNRSWGAFVRVETPIENQDENAARRRLEQFATRVAASLPAVFGAPIPDPAGPAAVHAAAEPGEAASVPATR
jgi:EpsI family protein